MENLDTPSPPNQGWENGAFLSFARLHPCLGGMGVCCSILFCPRLQSWTKQMENLDPPLPPKSRMGKWRVFAPRVASSLIWGWGFAGPFYFVQDCRSS